MALIHTIQIAVEKKSGNTVSSTRKSENRRYTACIVATTTEATIAYHEAERAKGVMMKADAEARIARLSEKLGMTAEEADKKLSALGSAWNKARWAAQDAIRAERNQPYGHVTDAEGEARAKKNGAVNPYYNEDGSKSDLYFLAMAGHDLRSAEYMIERNAAPALGSEAVLSWHHSVALADKAMASHAHVAKRGDKLTIRTDIEVRETKKRGMKE